jgi:N-acetyl-gamma-glutamyl-phosphate reductase
MLTGAMRTKVFVDGHEGTTGLQIHERLAVRADIELLVIDAAHRKDPAARAAQLNAADVAFLCLPDVAAKESAALVTNPRTCVIDASTAHRIDPAWVYGVPELAASYRAAIRAGKRIAKTSSSGGQIGVHQRKRNRLDVGSKCHVRPLPRILAVCQSP